MSAFFYCFLFVHLFHLVSTLPSIQRQVSLPSYSFYAFSGLFSVIEKVLFKPRSVGMPNESMTKPCKSYDVFMSNRETQTK